MHAVKTDKGSFSEERSSAVLTSPTVVQQLHVASSRPDTAPHTGFEETLTKLADTNCRQCGFSDGVVSTAIETSGLQVC